MKFTYAYKTSDGVRHEAAMDAESREAVFAALRERGIKAIKVVAADGSKANGEVSCPTVYTPEASSINFRRSVKYGFGCLGAAIRFRLAKLGFKR